MIAPRPETKCRRCRFTHAQHVVIGSRALAHCPDGSGRTFQRHTERRAVLRFDGAELATLEAVLRNAARAGGTARELVTLIGKVRRAASQRGPRADVESAGVEAKAS